VTTVFGTATVGGIRYPVSAAVTLPGTVPPPQANVTVDFTKITRPVDPLGVGITLSTYSGGGQATINRSPQWKAMLANLAPGHVRIPLRWNKGNPGSSAGGAQTSGDADAYVQNIKSIGAIPFIVYGGDSTDNGISPGDAAAFIHHYNDAGGQHGGPVRYWVIGNEPSGGAGGGYVSALPGIVAAMRAADPLVVLSAPAAAYWDTGLIQAAAKVPGVGILSWHAYNGGDASPGGFPDQSAYGANVAWLRNLKPGLLYGCEEANWHYAGGSPAFFDWRNTCFLADAAGQVLSAGGHFTQYADSNGPLGLMNDGSGQGQPGSFLTTLPAYNGIGIWTGMAGAFKRWGSNMVQASSTYPGTVLGVYASDNGKIVLVNKDTAPHPVTIAMKGKTAGTYTVHASQQNNPTGPFMQAVQPAPYAGGVISWTVPAGTVASVDVS
jgi:hypothetical protein